MRLVNISVLRPGEELGYAIRTQDGRVLLPANTMLTYNFIQRLKSFGINAVYIHDDFFDDVCLQPCLTDETKTAALCAVEEAYKSLGKKKLVNSNIVKSAASNIVIDIKKALISEPVGILNMYAVNDDKCLHAVNVSTIVTALAIEHNCSPLIVSEYTVAALLHDLHLNNMSEDSNPAHAEETKNYLKAAKDYSVRTYMGVGMHHERFDGSGPNKIAGEKIAEAARMIAVADVYDSLLNGYGPYSKLDMNYAVERLHNLSGTMLDPTFVGYFNSSVSIYPVGATVLLNNGYKAVVVAQNYKMPTRPRVRLSMPAKVDCIEINLMTNLTMFIEKIL